MFVIVFGFLVGFFFAFGSSLNRLDGGGVVAQIGATFVVTGSLITILFVLVVNDVQQAKRILSEYEAQAAGEVPDAPDKANSDDPFGQIRRAR